MIIKTIIFERDGRTVSKTGRGRDVDLNGMQVYLPPVVRFTHSLARRMLDYTEPALIAQELGA